MKELEQRIAAEGKVFAGDVLKVDSFLNHQMDVALFARMGQAWRELFPERVTKILTIEASGIGIACLAAQAFGVPCLFAKKSRTKNIAGSVYTAQVESYTHGGVYTILVAKEYLQADDEVLILDDFLANGNAMLGLISLAEQAGARVVGAGAAIEKVYQGGGDRVRSKGVRLESLARIQAMSPEDGVVFC